MPFLKTAAERAAEVKTILTIEWPMEPFLPVKRLREPVRIGEFPDTGFIYRARMNMVYLGFIDDIVPVNMNETKIPPMGDLPGGIHIAPKVIRMPALPELDAKLGKLERREYASLEKLVEDGWVVD